MVQLLWLIDHPDWVDMTTDSSSLQIFKTIEVSLITMHVFSILIQLIRNIELSKRGIPDVNGVLRAPLESTLGKIEALVSSVLFGFVI